MWGADSEDENDSSIINMEEGGDDEYKDMFARACENNALDNHFNDMQHNEEGDIDIEMDEVAADRPLLEEGRGVDDQLQLSGAVTLRKESSEKETEGEEGAAATNSGKGLNGEPDDNYDGATIGRLVSMAAPEKWLLLAGTISLFISSCSTLMIPMYAGQIVDALAKDDTDAAVDMLHQALLAMLIWGIVGSIFASTRGAMFNIAGERLVARVRKTLYVAIIKQDIGFFDANRTGELLNRLSSDATKMQSALTTNVSIGLRTTAQAIGALVFLFIISWKLTLLMMVIVPVISVSAVLYGRYVKKLGKDVQDALARGNQVAEEAISNIRTVRSFSKEDEEAGVYDIEIETSYRLGKSAAIAYGGFLGLTSFCSFVGISLILWYGAVLVLDGELSSGKLASFVLYTVYVGIGFGSMAALYGDLMKALGASQRVFQLLDRDPTVRYDGGTRPREFIGEVEFRNVSFAYPTRPDIPVLRDLSLRLRPGKVHALVGPSGGGKSTCIALLEGYYYCNGGGIYLDGTNIREIDPTWMRSYIGLVKQEPSLFARTISHNIAYGGSEAEERERHEQTKGLESVYVSPQENGRGIVDMERVEKMAKISNADEFIQKFPDKYETEVGEHGIMLSGGQKQRVAIARALYPAPKLLLLDEATSALDSKSEALVQEALDRLLLAGNHTVLIIAHRLSTVRNADVVYVIDNGQVQQEGTHDELLLQDGLYRKLVQKQLQADVKENWGVVGDSKNGLKEE